MDQYSFERAVCAAQQHRLIYQYTTFGALEKIIGNKSLRLSRLDLVNDKIENSAITKLWKQKVFVSCFTHREHESYFFWKTYAKGSTDGVRITFDSRTLGGLSVHPDEKCKETPLSLCKRSSIGVAASTDIKAENWGVYDYSCIDIMYLPRDETGECLENYQGRLKYIEWDMECETRLRIAVRPKGLEFISDGRINKYLIPENDYIYVLLSDEVLNSMQITLTPVANKDLRGKVERLLRENNLFDKVQINRSVLTGEVK
jgi:hypothetical protein